MSRCFRTRLRYNFRNRQILLRQFLRFEQAFARVRYWCGVFLYTRQKRRWKWKREKKARSEISLQVNGCMEIIVHIHFGGNNTQAGIPVQFHYRKLLSDLIRYQSIMKQTTIFRKEPTRNPRKEPKAALRERLEFCPPIISPTKAPMNGPMITPQGPIQKASRNPRVQPQAPYLVPPNFFVP